MTNCLFFGDSITYGEYDGILGGWVDYLKRFCHQKYYNENAKEVNVFNLGIGGESTYGLLKRIDAEIKVRISTDTNLIFLFYGANDLAIKNNVDIVSIQQFEQNILKAIQIAKQYTSEIFLLTILPISYTIDGKIVPSGKLRTNTRVDLYNQVLEKIATKQDIQLLNTHAIIAENTETYFPKMTFILMK